MELCWSTFLREILNLLVLVWLLKRFFYRPLQSVIARRQQDIDARLASAEQMQRQAQQLQRDYEGRLYDWRKERQKLSEDLEQELKHQRLQREQKLADELKTIQRGRILREILKQDRLSPMAIEFQLAWMMAFNDGLLDGCELRALAGLLQQLLAHVDASGLTLDAASGPAPGGAEVSGKSAAAGGDH